MHWNYYPYRDQELPAVLARRGYRCYYLNPLEYKGSGKAPRFSRVNPRPPVEGLTVIDRFTRFRKSFFLFLYENLLNVKAVRKYRPDVVISTSHLSAVLTCLVCRYRGIRFIFDVTDDWELADPSLAGKFYKWIIKPVMARFAFAVTATSEKQFRYFDSRRKDRTRLIPNGVSPDLQAGLRNAESPTPASDEVNFIGSLRDWYNFGLLFDVFTELRELNLNIYGQGPLYQQLKKKSENIANIHVHGNIPNQSIPALLLRSRFGVLPLVTNALNESTCPIKLLEYWAASRAVIATPVAEVRRIGGDALLYAGTRESFLEKARLLLSDNELASRLGEKGLQKIKEIHNYGSIAAQFMEIFTLT